MECYELSFLSLVKILKKKHTYEKILGSSLVFCQIAAVRTFAITAVKSLRFPSRLHFDLAFIGSDVESAVTVSTHR